MNDGIVIIGEKLRLEVARRGMTLTAFTKKAAVSPRAMNAAVHSRPVSTATRKRILTTLQRIAPLDGSELFAAPAPTSKTA